MFDRVTLLSNQSLEGLAETLIYAALFIGMVALVIGFWEYYRNRNKGDDE